MPKRTIRLTDAIDQRVQSAAKLRGYSTPTAFVRAAIKKELDEHGEGSAPNEKILGYIREVRQDVRRVERAQQALFALVDSFDVTAYLRERGLATQKLPERLEIVPALPMTATGKIQKHVLRADIKEKLGLKLDPGGG